MKFTPLSSSANLARAVSFFKNRSKLEQGLFVAIGFFFFVVVLLGIQRLSDNFSVIVPAKGGVLSEGVVGFPVNINPVFADKNAEHDLIKLIYSGLMKVGTSGDLEPDLAESFETSDDEVVYTFKIKPKAKFHDGTPVTASDVVFTIEQIKKPSSESPLRAIWSNVSVEASDESTVVFVLDEPNAGFLEQAMVGIIPAHIWENIEIGSLDFVEQMNYPIGSGPFVVKKVRRSESLGIPSQYLLTAFKDYVGGRPYLDRVEISFFPNEADLLDALTKNKIRSAALVSPQSLADLSDKSKKIITAPMQRVFGVFFNQTEDSVLQDKTVRQAIREAINSDELVQSVFSGYAHPTASPLPFPLSRKIALPRSERKTESESENKKFLPGEQLLLSDDWELNPLTGVREKDGEKLELSLATARGKEFEEVANFIKQSLERIGFAVNVETFDITHLNQEIIRPRNYEMLLFGEAFDRTIDLYPFWHSSQRDDPGLNVARYANSDVDKLLKELRAERNSSERGKIIIKIEEEIEADVPAVFLYSPEFLYLSDNKIKNVSIPTVVRSSDRFSNINKWYVYTDTIWKVFLNNEN